jgi:hypothetical protein
MKLGLLSHACIRGETVLWEPTKEGDQSRSVRRTGDELPSQRETSPEDKETLHGDEAIGQGTVTFDLLPKRPMIQQCARREKVSDHDEVRLELPVTATDTRTGRRVDVAQTKGTSTMSGCSNPTGFTDEDMPTQDDRGWALVAEVARLR